LLANDVLAEVKTAEVAAIKAYFYAILSDKAYLWDVKVAKSFSQSL